MGRCVLIALFWLTGAGCGGVHDTRPVDLVGPLEAGGRLVAVLSPPFDVKYQLNSLCFHTVEPTPADPNRGNEVLDQRGGTYFSPTATIWGTDGTRYELPRGSSGNAPKFCFYAGKEALPSRIGKIEIASPEFFAFSAVTLSTQSIP